MHDALDTTAYAALVQLLRELLVAIGHRTLSEAELQAIVYRGHFAYQNHRYEYNPATRHYEQLDVSTDEYTRLLGQLNAQLQQLDYTYMTVVQRNRTIYEGVFEYDGYDWVYNYDTQCYDRSLGSQEQQATPATPATSEQPEVVYDPEPEPLPQPLPETIYSSGADEPAPPTRRPLVVVSRDRGDQPPQTFVDDESAELLEPQPQPQPQPEPLPAVTATEAAQPVEQEPGVGYYPVATMATPTPLYVEEPATRTVDREPEVQRHESANDDGNGDGDGNGDDDVQQETDDDAGEEDNANGEEDNANGEEDEYEDVDGERGADDE